MTAFSRKMRAARRHRRQHPGTYIAGGVVLVALAFAAAWLSVRPLESMRQGAGPSVADGAAEARDTGAGAGGSFDPDESETPPAPAENEPAARLPAGQGGPGNGGQNADGPAGDPVSVAVPASGGDPAPMPEADPVDEALARAEAAMQANRLTTPAGDNALGHFERVLEQEPDNGQAREGIRRIVQRYLALSREARQEGQPDRAAIYLLRAGQVHDTHEVNGALTDSLAGEVASVYDALLTRGSEYLAAGEREQGRERLLQASRLVPEDGRAQAALAALDAEPDGRVIRDDLNSGGSGPAMVRIPAGSFTMGNEETRESEVAVERPFALSRYEVTVADFRRFVEQSGHVADNHGCEVYENRWEYREQNNWHSPGFPQNPDHPVVCVSWNDAQAYVAWLSVQTGESYRLPTEAEWEYALVTGTDMTGEVCRLGNVGDLWLKGRFPREEAFECADGSYFTTSVGSWPPDGLGLNDMVGNAREWVLDCWNRSHRGRPDGQAARLSGSCSSRVIKGSSWLTGEPGIAPSHRVEAPVNAAYNAVGFRVVRELESGRQD